MRVIGKEEWRSSARPLVLLLSLTLTVVAGCGDAEAERFPLQGKVTVDGKPAERVMVQLQSIDKGLSGNDRYPVAMTSEDGLFAFGASSDNPGLLAGQYTVSFAWLSSPDLDAIDLLKGTYANPESTEFTLQIPDQNNVTFELTKPR